MRDPRRQEQNRGRALILELLRGGLFVARDVGEDDRETARIPSPFAAKRHHIKTHRAVLRISQLKLPGDDGQRRRGVIFERRAQ